MKTCTKCGKHQHLEEFYRDRTAKDGRRSHCKSCSAAYIKSAQSKRKEWWDKRGRDLRRKRAAKPEVRERLRAQGRAHYWRNAEAMRENTRKRYQANPDTWKANAAAYKKRKRGARVVQKINRTTIYERDHGLCHICGRRVSPRRFDLDHLVPISKGGDHVASNVAVAHPRCNRSRGDGRIPAQLLLLG